jgi:DNA-binding LacI/PurR family transcriptional regulator
VEEVADVAATLDTVAALAGVSRQTVSNALHHPDRLKAATRERVLDAVRRSGYRPSLPARQLATRRAHAIAVRADPQQDGISGLVLDTFFHGLAEAGHDNGLRVVLYPAQATQEEEVALVDDLLYARAADAVVLTATSSTDERPTYLAATGQTFCAFGRPWGHDDAPHDWVDVDGAAGTALAVAHALERGCRRVAFLGWPDDGATGADRRRGWVEALDAADVPGPRLEDAAHNLADAAEAATRRLLDRPAGERPDAIVCVSDTLALGAHRAASSPAAGDPPLVIGFDATPVAGALGLPSVAQPIREAAHACLDLLVPRLAGDDPAARGVLLTPSLARPSP